MSSAGTRGEPARRELRSRSFLHASFFTTPRPHYLLRFVHLQSPGKAGRAGACAALRVQLNGEHVPEAHGAQTHRHRRARPCLGARGARAVGARSAARSPRARARARWRCVLRHRAAPPAFAAALTDPARIDRTYPPAPQRTTRYESTWPPAPRAYYAPTNFLRDLTYLLILYFHLITINLKKRGQASIFKI